MCCLTQRDIAGAVTVFIHTNPFRDAPQYSRTLTVPMHNPSSDTRVVVFSTQQRCSTSFTTQDSTTRRPG
jgi:hypothetical protein